ncbi:MAG TPA: glycoside hydrolase family 38 C-terminal domain-containing protein, partial [Planctomycetota bacterium]|nr:glycoside hydrolase family 38 C-terminal domain-containing protein [Planctomycetota bacterium]
FADALVTSRSQRAAVDAGAGLVDLRAVRRKDWDRVLVSCDAMVTRVAVLSDRAKDHTVHLIGHTHIDMDWMWTWKDTVHCVRRDLKAVVDLMDDYPEVTFTHSQVPTYQIAQEYDPDVFARIRSRIADGRWEVAASTWVEADLAMSDGEAIARSQLMAHRWCRDHLGAEPRVFWAPDNFSHPGNMPQLAAAAGHDAYFHWRCNPGRDQNWPARAWQGIDGTEIVSFASAYGGLPTPSGIVAMALEYRRSGLVDSHFVWGAGDHGGGLSRLWLDCMRDIWRDLPLLPRIAFGTMRRLLERTLPHRRRLPRNRGETYVLFEGCFTTHARMKALNRRCENDLLTAEALSAMARMDVRERMRGCWAPALFNGFHDILCGASVRDSYRDAYRRARSTLHATARIRQEALEALVPRRGGSGIALINHLGFARPPGPVEVPVGADVRALIDHRGRGLPLQRIGRRQVFVCDEMPALARSTFAAAKRPATRPGPRVVDEGASWRIETACAIARVHKASGTIGSYHSHRLDRELVAYGVPKTLSHMPTTRADLALNVFTLVDESPNAMSAWLINDPVREDHLLRSATTELVDSGPVFARFRVRHRFRSSRISEDIIFWHDLDRVDFVATIDWREKGDLKRGIPQLKVSFTTALSAPRAVFDMPYAPTERPADGQEQPTQRWLDVVGDEFGYALYNGSQYGCDVLGARARLTLLRNAYTPDPDTDTGRHVMRFAFEPHERTRSIAETIRRGIAFDRSPEASRCSARPDQGEPALRIDASDGVVVTAVKPAERGSGTIVRLFESTGAAGLVRLLGLPRDAVVLECDLVEREGRSIAVTAGEAVIRLRPYEIKTMLLDPARPRPGGLARGRTSSARQS